MTRRLTSSEAIELIETVFESQVDSNENGLIEAFIGDMDVGRASQDIGGYLAMIQSDIDTDTISVTADQTEIPSVDCVRIIIRTEH